MMDNAPAARGTAYVAAEPLLTAQSTQEPTRHWPALDGLRAVAVLGVIFYHVGLFRGGYLGVDVFFVLSGFLITSLLITEWDARGGRVSFRDFYARRILRLFPALGCVIIASLILVGILAITGGPADHADARTTLEAVPWVAAFAGNWVRAFESHAPIGSLGVLGQTWSLAVEEQFYLLWPALFVLFMRRRMRHDRLALTLALLAVADMIYRAALTHLGYGVDRIYYATDTHCDGLLIGCAVAFWLSHCAKPRPGEPRHARPRLSDRATKTMTWLAVTVLAALFLAEPRQGTPLETSAAVLASGMITVAVVTGRTPDAIARLLTARTAVLIGRRSYGLYLWHYLMLAFTQALCAPYHTISLDGPWQGRMIFATITIAGVAVSFLLAEVSYRRVELPALRLKRKFRRTR